MESETKPNKAHHENGQKESLDPAKIAPTKCEDYARSAVDDLGLKKGKLMLKTKCTPKSFFSL
jgi:hypothetical protein